MNLLEARACLLVTADSLRQARSLLHSVDHELEMPEGWEANCESDAPNWPAVSVQGCAGLMAETLGALVEELEAEAGVVLATI